MAHDTTELAKKFRASGLSPKKFSEKHKIPLSTLHYHLFNHRKLSGQSGPQFISLTTPPERPSTSTTITIIRGSFTQDQISAIITDGIAQ